MIYGCLLWIFQGFLNYFEYLLHFWMDDSGAILDAFWSFWTFLRQKHFLKDLLMFYKLFSRFWTPFFSNIWDILWQFSAFRLFVNAYWVMIHFLDTFWPFRTVGICSSRQQIPPRNWVLIHLIYYLTLEITLSFCLVLSLIFCFVVLYPAQFAT